MKLHPEELKQLAADLGRRAAMAPSSSWGSMVGWRLQVAAAAAGAARRRSDRSAFRGGRRAAPPRHRAQEGLALLCHGRLHRLVSDQGRRRPIAPPHQVGRRDRAVEAHAASKLLIRQPQRSRRLNGCGLIVGQSALHAWNVSSQSWLPDLSPPPGRRRQAPTVSAALGQGVAHGLRPGDSSGVACLSKS